MFAPYQTLASVRTSEGRTPAKAGTRIDAQTSMARAGRWTRTNRGLLTRDWGTLILGTGAGHGAEHGRGCWG
jgi:hypothetical protein